MSFGIESVMMVKHFFHNTDVIHVRHIAGNGNWKGISPIQVLKNSNDFDKAVREFSLKEMQSLRDSFILTYTSNVDKEKERLLYRISRDSMKKMEGFCFKNQV